jgi:hypothetical protein
MTEINHDVQCPKCHTRFRSAGRATRFACPVCIETARHPRLAPGKRVLYFVWGLAPALLTPLVLALAAEATHYGLPAVLAAGLFVTVVAIGFPALQFAWSERLQRHSPGSYPMLASVLLTPVMLALNFVLVLAAVLVFVQLR